MSSYHSSFKYLNKKSDEDFGWIIAHFDPDNGETDSYLSQDQIYTESYNGTKRTLYGTKYNTVANIKITVIKQDGSDFSLGDCRTAYRWLTGNPEASWMDLYIGDEVKYRLLCTIQDVKPQKMDARTVGLNIYCESLSPWAYSPLITISKTLGAVTFDINNETDDLYTPVYLKTTYTNKDSSFLYIDNATLGERTSVDNLSVNETIVLDGNMTITSDKPNKVFGSSFNFVWPRLKAGLNKFNVVGSGDLTLEYYYPIKMGDCAQNINIVRDPICDDFNNIQVDTLPWERVSGTPTTLSGYGITDAYSKTQIDDMCEVVSNKVSDEADITNVQENYPSIEYLNSYYYNYGEIDEMLVDKLDATEGSVQSMHIEKGAITGDKLAFGSVNGKKIAEGSINTTHIDTTYLDKTPKAHAGTIPHLVTSEGVYIALHEKLDKPEIDGESGQVLTLDVNGKTQWKTISSTSGGGSTYVEIDEQELNTMLAEVLGE